MVGTLLLSVSAVGAGKHPACNQSGTDHFGISVEQLRVIAETEQPGIAALFYKRASLRGLMEDSHAFQASLCAARSDAAYF